MVSLTSGFGSTFYASIDGGSFKRLYEFLGDSQQKLRATDISGGDPIVQSRANAMEFWNQTIQFVKNVRLLHHPNEKAKSLTFKFELVKDFDEQTIEFKYEINNDVSYEALYNKVTQTITSEPRDTYTVNWVDFIGFFDAFNIFIREIATF